MTNNKIQISNVSIGADPELFLYNEKTEKFVPVCGLVGGTKEEPKAVADNGKFSVQEDNVMLEYTIPPSYTKDDFLKNINFMKDYIRETVLAPKGLVPKYIASAHFTWDDLNNDEAQLFGCSPDYNAYSMEQNIVGKGNPLMRTSGGHIHIGYDNPDYQTNIDLVKAMDIFLGVPSILLDEDTFRRDVYGKAGAHRMKPYGLEYRVLSTFWTSTDEFIKWAYINTKQAIDYVNAGGIKTVTNEDEIVKCINTCNKELAKEIIEDYNINMPKVVVEDTEEAVLVSTEEK